MKKKGISTVAVVIVAGVVIVAAAILIGLGGIGFGGGKGDGEGTGTTEQPAPEVTEEVIPVTEEIEYLDVSVSENDYLYQNGKVTVEELIEKLTTGSAAGTPVKITDENASQKAYRKLIDALEEHGIRYIEENMS